jgi:hypothetical protein
MFGSTILLKTDTVANEATAGRLAERALEARIVALFGDSGN